VRNLETEPSRCLMENVKPLDSSYESRVEQSSLMHSVAELDAGIEDSEELQRLAACNTAIQSRTDTHSILSDDVSSRSKAASETAQ
jgi:hypothetical protein